jgi:hypothetical protein
MKRPSKEPPRGADLEQRKRWMTDVFVYYLELVDEWHRNALTPKRKRELCDLLNTDHAFRDIFGAVFFTDASAGHGWPVASPKRCLGVVPRNSRRSWILSRAPRLRRR